MNRQGLLDCWLFIYMEMKDIITKLIQKIIVPKYSNIKYEVSRSINDDEIEILVYYYTYDMDDNAKGIIDDTKMILSMLGLSNINVGNISFSDHNHIEITGIITK